MTRPALFVVNVGAGNAASCRELVRELASAWRGAGHPVSIQLLDPDDGLALDEHLPDEPSLVVAAGGDGTVRFCAEALAGTGHTLAVLPLGTMNLFARSLGLSTDPATAARQLEAGTDRQLDAGSVDGRLFLNAFSLGLYPQLAALRERRRVAHRHWPKLVRWTVDTVVSGLAVLRRWRTLRFVLELDGRRQSGKVVTFAVTNNERAIPPASTDLDRGELVVYLPDPVSRGGLALLFLRAIVMPPTELAPLEVLRARELTVHVPDGTPMMIDGEVEATRGTLELRSLRGACRVRVPGEPGDL